MTTPVRLFDLPLGSRFSYVEHPEHVYVLLDRVGSGKVAMAPSGPDAWVAQGIFSAHDSPAQFRALMVNFVPVVPSEQMVKALERADQFITNGIALGFIRMPDKDTPDSAHETPGIVQAALEAARKGA